MKNFLVVSLSVICIMVFSANVSHSRGGFGGGRGGFGGAEFRGGGGGFNGHIGREQRSSSPSQLNRRQGDRKPRPAPQSRPAVSGPGQKAFQGDLQGKPSRENLQKFLNLPPENRSGLSDLGKVGAGAAAGALGAAGLQHLMGKPGAGERPARLDGKLSGEGRQDARAAERDRNNADQVRNNIKDRYNNMFTPQWWADHPNLAHQYWENMGRYQYAWNHWWRPAAWGALAGFIAGSAWSSPQYYDYSSGIYYEGDSVYNNEAPIASASEYYSQASEIANAPATATDQQEELMPLGVFAITEVGATNSNTLLQLAVDKQGIIKGTYYNSSTQTTRPVKGSVDRQTQRAAWSFADGKDKDFVMETGIYNLTLDQTEALVHFGKDKTQRWLMVRMEQPQEKNTKAAQDR